MEMLTTYAIDTTTIQPIYFGNAAVCGEQGGALQCKDIFGKQLVIKYIHYNEDDTEFLQARDASSSHQSIEKGFGNEKNANLQSVINESELTSLANKKIGAGVVQIHAVETQSNEPHDFKSKEQTAFILQDYNPGTDLQSYLSFIGNRRYIVTENANATRRFWFDEESYQKTRLTQTIEFRQKQLTSLVQNLFTQNHLSFEDGENIEEIFFRIFKFYNLLCETQWNYVSQIKEKFFNIVSTEYGSDMLRSPQMQKRFFEMSFLQLKFELPEEESFFRFYNAFLKEKTLQESDIFLRNICYEIMNHRCFELFYSEYHNILTEEYSWQSSLSQAASSIGNVLCPNFKFSILDTNFEAIFIKSLRSMYESDLETNNGREFRNFLQQEMAFNKYSFAASNNNLVFDPFKYSSQITTNVHNFFFNDFKLDSPTPLSTLIKINIESKLEEGRTLFHNISFPKDSIWNRYTKDEKILFIFESIKRNSVEIIEKVNQIIENKNSTLHTKIQELRTIIDSDFRDNIRQLFTSSLETSSQEENIEISMLFSHICSPISDFVLILLQQDIPKNLDGFIHKEQIAISNCFINPNKKSISFSVSETNAQIGRKKQIFSSLLDYDLNKDLWRIFLSKFVNPSKHLVKYFSTEIDNPDDGKKVRIHRYTPGYLLTFLYKKEMRKHENSASDTVCFSLPLEEHIKIFFHIATSFSLLNVETNEIEQKNFSDFISFNPPNFSAFFDNLNTLLQEKEPDNETFKNTIFKVLPKEKQVERFFISNFIQNPLYNEHFHFLYQITNIFDSREFDFSFSATNEIDFISKFYKDSGLDNFEKNLQSRLLCKNKAFLTRFKTLLSNFQVHEGYKFWPLDENKKTKKIADFNTRELYKIAYKMIDPLFINNNKSAFSTSELHEVSVIIALLEKEVKILDTLEFYTKPLKEISKFASEYQEKSVQREQQKQENVEKLANCYRECQTQIKEQGKFWKNIHDINQRNKPKTFLEMRKTLASCIKTVDSAFQLVEHLRQKGINHNDQHWNNVFVEKDTGKVSLIDFGFTTQQAPKGEEKYVNARHTIRNFNLINNAISFIKDSCENTTFFLVDKYIETFGSSIAPNSQGQEENEEVFSIVQEEERGQILTSKIKTISDIFDFFYSSDNPECVEIFEQLTASFENPNATLDVKKMSDKISLILFQNHDLFPQFEKRITNENRNLLSFAVENREVFTLMQKQKLLLSTIESIEEYIPIECEFGKQNMDNDQAYITMQGTGFFSDSYLASMFETKFTLEERIIEGAVKQVLISKTDGSIVTNEEKIEFMNSDELLQISLELMRTIKETVSELGDVESRILTEFDIKKDVSIFNIQLQEYKIDEPEKINEYIRKRCFTNKRTKIPLSQEEKEAKIIELTRFSKARIARQYEKIIEKEPTHWQKMNRIDEIFELQRQKLIDTHHIEPDFAFPFLVEEFLIKDNEKKVKQAIQLQMNEENEREIKIANGYIQNQNDIFLQLSKIVKSTKQEFLVSQNVKKESRLWKSQKILLNERLELAISTFLEEKKEFGLQKELLTPSEYLNSSNFSIDGKEAKSLALKDNKFGFDIFIEFNPQKQTYTKHYYAKREANEKYKYVDVNENLHGSEQNPLLFSEEYDFEHKLISSTLDSFPFLVKQYLDTTKVANFTPPKKIPSEIVVEKTYTYESENEYYARQGILQEFRTYPVDKRCLRMIPETDEQFILRKEEAEQNYNNRILQERNEFFSNPSNFKDRISSVKKTQILKEIARKLEIDEQTSQIFLSILSSSILEEKIDECINNPLWVKDICSYIKFVNSIFLDSYFATRGEKNEKITNIVSSFFQQDIFLYSNKINDRKWTREFSLSDIYDIRRVAYFNRKNEVCKQLLYFSSPLGEISKDSRNKEIELYTKIHLLCKFNSIDNSLKQENDKDLLKLRHFVLKELKEKYHIPEKAIKFINEKILNSGSEPAQKQKQLEFVLKRIEMNQKILVKQTQNCQLLPKNQEQKTKIEMKQTLQQAEESILYLYQCKNRFIHSNNTGINFAFNELQDTNLQRQDFQRASDLFDIAFVRIFNKILEIPNEVLKRQTIELFKNKDVDLHTFLNEVNLNSELNQIKQFIIDSSNAPSVSSLKVVNDGLFPSYSINDSFEEIEEEKQFFKSLRRIMENNETNKQQNPKSFVGYPQVHSLWHCSSFEEQKTNYLEQGIDFLFNEEIVAIKNEKNEMFYTYLSLHESNIQMPFLRKPYCEEHSEKHYSGFLTRQKTSKILSFYSSDDLFKVPLEGIRTIEIQEHAEDTNPSVQNVQPIVSELGLSQQTVLQVSLPDVV